MRAPSEPRIRDSLSIRALAHPLRLRLLEVLAAEGTATATRCSELVDESPANCSFHLRTLAKHGFIERAPGSGRERPWRLTQVSQSVSADPDDPEAAAAGAALSDVILDWEFGRLRAARHRTAPPGWRGAMFRSGATLWLTPEEAGELDEQFTRLVMRFVARTEDPAQRPTGSRPVRLFAATSLVPGLRAGPDAADPAADGAPVDENGKP